MKIVLKMRILIILLKLIKTKLKVNLILWMTNKELLNKVKILLFVISLIYIRIKMNLNLKINLNFNQRIYQFIHKNKVLIIVLFKTIQKMSHVVCNIKMKMIFINKEWMKNSTKNIAKNINFLKMKFVCNVVKKYVQNVHFMDNIKIIIIK